MSTSTLINATGAIEVTRQQLDKFEPPPATETWFPIRHSVVLDTVTEQLQAAGFQPTDTKLIVARNGSRFFGTLDLADTLGQGVHLAVGIRNSVDRSIPIGFCAGSRTLVCSNLSFSSDVVVARKHTRNGANRFAEALTLAVTGLKQFKHVEADRIQRFQTTNLSEDSAALYMLQAFKQELVSHILLKRIIKEWEQPSFEEFLPRTKWSMLNAFTTVLGERAKTNPQVFARTTIAVQALLDGKPVHGELTSEVLPINGGIQDVA